VLAKMHTVAKACSWFLCFFAAKKCAEFAGKKKQRGNTLAERYERGRIEIGFPRELNLGMERLDGMRIM